jgi:hypothetical protein
VPARGWGVMQAPAKKIGPLAQMHASDPSESGRPGRRATIWTQGFDVTSSSVGPSVR